MDYSLLLGIAKKCPKSNLNAIKTPINDNNYRIIYSADGDYVYFMSIIDIFQEYNFRKRMEHSFKALKGKGYLLSSVPPKPYANRFSYFIISNILDLN